MKRYEVRWTAFDTLDDAAALRWIITQMYGE